MLFILMFIVLLVLMPIYLMLRNELAKTIMSTIIIVSIICLPILTLTLIFQVKNTSNENNRERYYSMIIDNEKFQIVGINKNNDNSIKEIIVENDYGTITINYKGIIDPIDLKVGDEIYLKLYKTKKFVEILLCDNYYFYYIESLQTRKECENHAIYLHHVIHFTNYGNYSEINQ